VIGAEGFFVGKLAENIYNGDYMKNFFVPIVVVIAIGMAGLVAIRFLGGDEDVWVCTNKQWVRHGNPSSPMPQIGCGIAWQEQTVKEIGVTFSYPADMSYRKEIADDAGRIRTAGFYVEKGSLENPTYQLYALYQPLETVTEKELDKVKTGMKPDTVKEAFIDGIKGVEGLIEISGPKAHYSTAIIKEGRLFTVSTWPPTEENKRLTDQIITTFRFE